MSETPAQKLQNVSVDLKANIYFDGKVVSHSIYDVTGVKKTLGLIYPGSYQFNTAAAERMVITAGSCKVKIKGEEEWKTYAAGMEFQVPANSAFEISVLRGIAEYLCIFE
ncbi:MAG: pyrimidine/purine nucleoside phosphorylase [Deltaproteobacteria bacterium]|nr:pyrimidine/purine nucleoside phosphorylase [Deltaproteobacteria bacterium]